MFDYSPEATIAPNYPKPGYDDMNRLRNWLLKRPDIWDELCEKQPGLSDEEMVVFTYGDNGSLSRKIRINPSHKDKYYRIFKKIIGQLNQSLNGVEFVEDDTMNFWEMAVIEGPDIHIESPLKLLHINDIDVSIQDYCIIVKITICNKEYEIKEELSTISFFKELGTIDNTINFAKELCSALKQWHVSSSYNINNLTPYEDINIKLLTNKQSPLLSILPPYQTKEITDLFKCVPSDVIINRNFLRSIYNNYTADLQNLDKSLNVIKSGFDNMNTIRSNSQLEFESFLHSIATCYITKIPSSSTKNPWKDEPISALLKSDFYRLFFEKHVIIKGKSILEFNINRFARLSAVDNQLNDNIQIKSHPFLSKYRLDKIIDDYLTDEVAKYYLDYSFLKQVKEKAALFSAQYLDLGKLIKSYFKNRVKLYYRDKVRRCFPYEEKDENGVRHFLIDTTDPQITVDWEYALLCIMYTLNNQYEGNKTKKWPRMKSESFFSMMKKSENKTEEETIIEEYVKYRDHIGKAIVVEHEVRKNYTHPNYPKKKDQLVKINKALCDIEAIKYEEFKDVSVWPETMLLFKLVTEEEISQIIEYGVEEYVSYNTIHDLFLWDTYRYCLKKNMTKTLNFLKSHYSFLAGKPQPYKSVDIPESVEIPLSYTSGEYNSRYANIVNPQQDILNNLSK